MHVHYIGEHISHVTSVHAVDRAQRTLQFFIGGFWWIICSIARDVRGKCREKTCLIWLLTSVNDLRRILQRYGRYLYAIGGKERRYQGIDEKI